MTRAPSLHQYLSLWRSKKGLSQEQVANILGVNKSTVHRWEMGKRAVDLADLERLAAIYGVDPVALLMAPDNVDLAAKLSRAKTVLETIPDEAAERWLGTGSDIAGIKLP